MIKDHAIIRKKFGEKVRLYSRKKDLTQDELAELCECSKQTISGTETGYSFPESKLLFNLSINLNIPLVYLFNFGDDKDLSDKELNTLISESLNKLDYEKKLMILKMIESIKD